MKRSTFLPPFIYILLFSFVFATHLGNETNTPQNSAFTPFKNYLDFYKFQIAFYTEFNRRYPIYVLNDILRLKDDFEKYILLLYKVNKAKWSIYYKYYNYLVEAVFEAAREALDEATPPDLKEIGDKQNEEKKSNENPRNRSRQIRRN